MRHIAQCLVLVVSLAGSAPQTQAPPPPQAPPATPAPAAAQTPPATKPSPSPQTPAAPPVPPPPQAPPAPEDFKKAVTDLASRDRKVQEAAIESLGRYRDHRALVPLTALRQGTLFLMGDVLVIVPTEKELKEFLPDGTELAPVTEAISGKLVLGPDGKKKMIDVSSLKRVVATNALKQKIAPVLSSLSLASPDPDARKSAAGRMGEDRATESLPLLESAMAEEKDRWVRLAMDEAIQMIRLADADSSVRKGAAIHLGEISGSNAVPQLKAMIAPGPDGRLPEKDKAVVEAVRAAVKDIESHEALTQTVSTSFEVLSLSSILMMIALGLAITFGVMGVINMAHGEMLMIGAYAAYTVQNVFHSVAPGHYDWYFVVAIPVSFLASASMGLLIERTLLQHLYGRPLESLLATWGISLMLQQLVRSIYGAANVDMKSPSYLSGGLQIMSGLTLSYNRIFIFVFSFLCLLGIYLLLYRSAIGLRIRAVVQNRSMSACLGVATGRVDALTFAIGAGVAGMAGCALSQLGTVGPGLGQTYIVDAFMVVVLGGVGKLMGTVVAAFGIGGVNKILESMIGSALPKWGPILSKVAVLVLLILFLQKKPSGLFAIKGRHADA
ncbi:MAG TPA: urea ABC transporter permease subunit UrtB [Planctomycetota bacterium]|nr:urea ABC transporter permease subunit UrtB [Planctomycetota bacterium]